MTDIQLYNQNTKFTPMLDLVNDVDAINSYYELLAAKYGSVDNIPEYLNRWLTKALEEALKAANSNKEITKH
tara:strand:- start:1145 stop:1360 length:216 start_codon:yes stop_codon:yes gene_type:complete